MTKEDLEKFSFLMGEIERIDNEIAIVKSSLKEISHVSDVVSGSSAEFPYTLHPVSVHGDSVRNTAAKAEMRSEISDLLAQKQQARKQYIELYNRIDAFISELPDMEMRQILSFHYVECLTYVQLADRMTRLYHGRRTYTVESLRKKEFRFWKHQKEKSPLD